MRVLALDYGSARCGCAVSDPTGVLATPLEPVLAPATRRGLARLRALVRELERRARRRRAAAVAVRRRLGADRRDARVRGRARAAAEVPVELYDERFTTRLAERTGGSRERGLARGCASAGGLARRPGRATRRSRVADSGERTAAEREAARLERERRRQGARRRALRPSRRRSRPASVSTAPRRRRRCRP